MREADEEAGVGMGIFRGMTGLDVGPDRSQAGHEEIREATLLADQDGTPVAGGVGSSFHHPAG